MTPKTQRLTKIIALIMCIGGLALFLGIAFKKNIRFFVTPTHIIQENLKHYKHLRLGGLVKEKSLKQLGLISHFLVTDGSIDITVHYEGVLPDLFREGQTIVAEGSFDPENGDVFKAKIILAKHDENYRPPTLNKDK